MKIYFAFIILTLITSCKKDRDVKDLKKEMVGTWELEFTSGMSGYIPQPAGNGQIIVLGPGGIFERKKNDTVLFSGNYTVGKKKDCYDTGNDIIFSTNETNNALYHYIQITDGKLIFNLPTCYTDGQTISYRRLK
jgi:hypothetical protein